MAENEESTTNLDSTNLKTPDFFLRVWKSRINNKECHLSALVLQALEAFEDWEATNDDKLKMMKYDLTSINTDLPSPRSF